MFIYNARKNEEYVDTRIRNYNSLKIKTTQSILPDPKNIKQHIKRANMQCFYWKNSLHSNIEKNQSM